jgi:o-succinylbenzoate synthase
MIRLFRYSLPLREGLRIAPPGAPAITLRQREGLILLAPEQVAAGRAPFGQPTVIRYCGEAAPLPGFSRESLAQLQEAAVRDAAAAVEEGDRTAAESRGSGATLERGDWDADSPSLPRVGRFASGPLAAFPSWRFAFESATVDLTAKSTAIPVSGLLAGSREAIVAKATELACSECQAVKLKVGRDPDVESELCLVREIRSLLREEQRLRLDANRAWSLETAIRFGSALRDLDLDYLEEPLRDSSELETFYAETGCPYALDETLRTAGDLRHYRHAAAFVVKPTLLGDSRDIRRLAAYGKPLVFSAAFESGVGIAHIARLAAQLSPDIPAGLDTYSWLAQDILEQPLTFANWRLHVPDELRLRTEKGTQLFY